MPDHADVLRPVEEYFTALNAGDDSALQQLFEPDGKVLPPGEATVTGRDAVGEFYRTRFAAVQFGRDLRVHDVVCEGNTGAVHCSTTGTVTIRATGHEQEVDSRELFVLRRGDDGWRIQYYMFNAPSGGRH